MQKIICFFILLSGLKLTAQDSLKKVSTLDSFYVTVHKDPRMEALSKKEAEVNEAKDKGPHAAKGYRLMILSTTDRQQAISVRSSLLQRFPEQKVYMSFQPPYMKLKFGNFVDKDEAERYRKSIKSASIVTTNIYLVPEMVEVKGDKSKDTDN